MIILENKLKAIKESNDDLKEEYNIESFIKTIKLTQKEKLDVIN